MSSKPTIVYTLTDEAPALATRSFLPVVKAFIGKIGIDVESKDISLAARVLAAFPDVLSADQKTEDDLAYLGKLALKPEANIIKLPNISASVPQLKATIKELQSKGYKLPDYPETPDNDAEAKIKKAYDKIKGSAVNPVLREGNSDRRAPKAVKEYAKKNPHKMGAWKSDSKSHVSTMKDGDFRHNEKSLTTEEAFTASVVFESSAGETKVLKESIPLEKGEIIDASVMSKSKLLDFLKSQMDDAKQKGILFSLHMKATMMKVSDPIIFGHAVDVYFAELFKEHGALLEKHETNTRNGFGNVLKSIDKMSADDKTTLMAKIEAILDSGPSLAMVDSDKGITNLHVPNDVIIDASMPAMIRTSGCMWNKDGKLQDTKAVIPDSSYAEIYQVVMDDCKSNGAFNPVTMGSVSNVGLMAKKAEEYGSHDKTFEMHDAGVVRVLDSNKKVLLEHKVQKGDLWRMCQVKDAPIKDWVQLALGRAKATGTPAVFWLDNERPHDKEIIKKIESTLKEHPKLESHILSPSKATEFTLKRVRKGENTISATGNVLRDYLTDLFPILELGTSAKMLSIVPLMNGGGLFETGAGGSAPKHVQQMNEEGHLRWDSLGEFLALAVSLEHISEKNKLPLAKTLGDALDDASTAYLMNGKSPSRKVNERDNRGTHFYLAMYWAQAMSMACKDKAVADNFHQLFKSLRENEEKINKELLSAQGQKVDLGGYFLLDESKVASAMRPSETFNAIIDGF